MEEQEIRLDELFESIKKRWLMIVLITLLATIISAVISFFVIKPTYEASTKIFIGKAEGEDQVYSQSDVMLYQNLMKTYTETIKTKDLVERALKNISSSVSPKVDSVQVLNNLTVSSIAETQILQIKYTNEKPEEARGVIQAITDEFMKTSKELVPNGNVQVIEKVELPVNPISPNKKMNIAIAFLLGLMVSIGLCFLLEFLDNTFKTKEQLERELDIPVLGMVPDIKEK